MTLLKKYRSLLTGLAFMPLGGAFGYFVGKLLKQADGRLPDLGPWIWFWLVADMFLVIAWHELGHVIGGKLSGFRFYLYCVGPLRIDGGAQGLEVKLNRNLSLWGGIAATCPPPDNIPAQPVLHRQMLLMVALGPGFSLLGALAFFPANWLWPQHPLAAAAFAIFGFMSLAIALATLIPYAAGGFVSDGARILSLLRKDDTAHRWVATAILGALADVERPRNWPASLIETVSTNAPADYDGIMGMWMRYAWHHDRKEFDAAADWLHRALAGVDTWPEAARPILYLSAAEFYAEVHHDAARAREYFALIKNPGFLPPASLALAEARILALEGDTPLARQRLAAGKQVLHQLSGSSREAILESIAELEARVA